MKVRNYIFIILMSVFFATRIPAQETDTLKSVNLDSLINTGQICFDQQPEFIEDDEIFVMPVQPKFPGGTTELIKYVYNNLKYPDLNKEGGPTGTVYIRFEITKSGKVGNVEILKGIHPILDEEAVRVIKSLPNFTPGMQDGKPMNVWYLIPVKFKLNKNL